MHFMQPSDDDDDMTWRTGDDRASQLHRWVGAVSADAEGPVLSHRREEPVFTRHHSPHPGCPLQQSRDYSDVFVSKSDHRPASSDLMSVCRLRHQTGARHMTTLFRDAVPFVVCLCIYLFVSPLKTRERVGRLSLNFQGSFKAPLG